jgi:hypothetical protein
VKLSEGGAVATQIAGSHRSAGIINQSLTTTGIEITAGKHYWEVKLVSKDVGSIMIGISRPILDPTGEYSRKDCTDGWFVCPYNGTLCGNGKQFDDAAGGYKQGDRVGVLVDFGNGSLRFFKNGLQHGSGYPAGSVAGPVVHAVQMKNMNNRARLLQNAEAPANI